MTDREIRDRAYSRIAWGLIWSLLTFVVGAAVQWGPWAGIAALGLSMSIGFLLDWHRIASGDRNDDA